MKIVLLKLVSLMTVLVLNYSIGWCQKININSSSTGEELIKDTIKVLIPISTIKQANIKLLERKALIELNKEQEYVIANYKKYVEEQDKIINDFQQRLKEVNEINNSLSNNINKQKTLTTICSSIAGTAILTTIVVLIAK